MNSTNTLGDFLKFLILKLQEKEVKLPLYEDHLWHDLFFQLKVDDQCIYKPKYIEELRFSWNDIYPQSEKLSALLTSFRTNVCVSILNTQCNEMYVSNEIAQLWYKELDKTDIYFRKYLDYATKKAEEKFTNRD